MAATANSTCMFTTEPDDALVCLICLEVAEEPWQHGKCGRLLCRACLEQHGTEKPCPNCRTQEPQYFQDNKSKRDIQALRVRCDNVNRKCEWVGTVDLLKNHVATCKFTLLPCPNQCGDGNQEVVRRHEINEHVENECGHTEISCRYESIGCDMKMQRKYMAAHEQDDKLHLHMTLNTTVKLQQTVVKLQHTTIKLQSEKTQLRERVMKLESNMQSMMEAIESLKQSGGKKSTKENNKQITQKLIGYRKIKDGGKVFKFPSFYAIPKGYHLSLHVDTNGQSVGKGTHVSAYVHFLKGVYDAELSWPFVGKINISLLNQLEDKHHHSTTTNISPELRLSPEGDVRNWGRPQFISHSMLGHDAVMNTQYLKDDTLCFRISVDTANHN